jgi:hypothetical protein
MVITKAEVSRLLTEAVAHHRHTEAARAAAASGQELALFHAWQAGIRLNQLKPIIGFGNWQTWLETNFCKPRKCSYQTAALYMQIDTQNEELRDPAAKVERVTLLKFDTIRKYKLGFAPEKDKPELEGNRKFPRLLHHLKIINEINRWKRRREVGHIEKEVEEERRDFRPEVYWFIRELFADDVTTLEDGRRVLILGDDYGDDGIVPPSR